MHPLTAKSLIDELDTAQDILSKARDNINKGFEDLKKTNMLSPPRTVVSMLTDQRFWTSTEGRGGCDFSDK